MSCPYSHQHNGELTLDVESIRENFLRFITAELKILGHSFENSHPIIYNDFVYQFKHNVLLASHLQLGKKVEICVVI